MENISQIGDLNQNTTILQGNIVGRDIVITQITGKSVDYKALIERIRVLEEALEDMPETKADRRLKFSMDLEDARAQEQQFREDVMRLAATFSKININTDRLRLAKENFDNGRFREANAILNVEAMSQDLDLLIESQLLKKHELVEIDQQLGASAEEWLVKAQVVTLNYDNPNWFKEAILSFEQSLRAQENIKNLLSYALFLQRHNQEAQVESLYLKALKIQTSKAELATILHGLGCFYRSSQRMSEAENHFLRSLKICERLSIDSPTLFEHEKAKLLSNVGIFYGDLHQMNKAKKYLLQSLKIYTQLAKTNPAKFEPELAFIANNLGIFYSTHQQINKARKFLLQSLKIRKILAESNPDLFEPDLAKSFNNLGAFYFQNKQMERAEKNYLQAFEIYHRLAKRNPILFEPSLASITYNLGNYYIAILQMEKAKMYYFQSLEIRELLARNNPSIFEPYLAQTLQDLGVFYARLKQMDEAEIFFQKAFRIYKRLAEANSGKYEPFLAIILNNMGSFYSDKNQMKESENYYLLCLEIRKRLSKSNPAKFESDLPETLNNLGLLYSKNRKFKSAEKYYLNSLEIVERLAQSNPVRYNSELSKIQGLLSYFNLLIQKYTISKQYSMLALTKDPTQNWLRANLGHANLLQGDFETAKFVYDEYIKNEPNQAEAINILIKDWADFEDVNSIPSSTKGQVDRMREYVLSS